MKIKFFDIPEEGLDFDFEAGKEPWLDQLFREVYQEDYVNTQGHVGINILKTCQNISIVGNTEVELEPVCDRCLEKFIKKSSSPIKLTMLPHKSMSFDDVGPNDDPGDDDDSISYYKTEELDLDDILKESLYLNIPIRDLCKEDCKGLCPQCGQNLNLKTCACKTEKIDPRLAALKNIKLK
ncbi:MAG: DUF177 domain-containing protein [Deltaproteobacteria bacterium]|nr:MAG: DUF177 domain-containing protein [Deltaproteobacteria bacterium]